MGWGGGLGEAGWVVGSKIMKERKKGEGWGWGGGRGAKGERKWQRNQILTPKANPR